MSLITVPGRMTPGQRIDVELADVVAPDDEDVRLLLGLRRQGDGHQQQGGGAAGQCAYSVKHRQDSPDPPVAPAAKQRAPA
jgi:hypothetical protein